VTIHNVTDTDVLYYVHCMCTKIVKKGRVRWFAYVERKDDADRIKCCMTNEIDETRQSTSEHDLL